MKNKTTNSFKDLLNRLKGKKEGRRAFDTWAAADSLGPTPEKAKKDFPEAELNKIVEIAKTMKRPAK